MSSLNLSSDGPAINRSYKSIVDSPFPTGAAASSPTYGVWAVYSVSAPLTNAFQNDSNKESTLRVQSTGEGELVDLIDEFSDGRIQFGFLKVKDSNSGLPKSILIAWCGEGVPERTKGYFGSHLAAVSKLLHGYHVQITARTDNDLTPEGIIRKVADSSGSKYSGENTEAKAAPPPTASKPVFTPTQSAGASSGFKALGSRSRTNAPQNTEVDEDGWSADAPRVVRTQLETVGTAYKPTKVNMAELTSQKPERSRFQAQQNGRSEDREDVVRGGYQPVGKIDIAALRRQAQESGQDDRPAPVKGAYEPVGKVDIAAIRARTQQSSGDAPSSSPAVSSARTGASGDDEPEAAPKSLAERSAAFSQSERITSMPKPKVANRFGGSQTSSFTGTKAPTPVGFGGSSSPSPAPVNTVNKNFADSGGKTPAQLWAERKARERGTSGASETTKPSAPSMQSQTSGGDGFQSGYGGKKWGAVSTSKTAAPVSTDEPADEDQAEDEPSTGGVSAMRDRFKNAAPIRPTDNLPGSFDDAEHAGEEEEEEDRAPPAPPMGSRPGKVALPGFARPTPPAPQEDEEQEDETVSVPPPPRQPREEEDEQDEDFAPDVRASSPIRVAMPTSRASALEVNAPEERFSPPPMPIRSMANTISAHQEPGEDEEEEQHHMARGAGVAAAQSALGEKAVAQPGPGAAMSGKNAIVQFDYEKAEDNELELKEGETITNIEMVDTDWWMGENSRGEKGLFPSNYVELEEGGEEHASAPAAPAAPAATSHAHEASGGKSAIAQFEYEAAEDNELSFPEGAKITNLEFPDADWWSGSYNGQSGLFPSNYVELEG